MWLSGRYHPVQAPDNVREQPMVVWDLGASLVRQAPRRGELHYKRVRHAGDTP